ncbi:MAG: hypothetical protein ATN36_01635 [Epulopiscium sp. Nele67-Bin005]|nr:MAG: hypothetical protein ATN36_01635 [Epulopiscium sp. Nele67-Bin005]
MQIGVIGLNHTTAPIYIREKFSFTDKKIDITNQTLDYGINEVVILCTCNRTEIYFCSEDIQENLEFIYNLLLSFDTPLNIKEFLFCYIIISNNNIWILLKNYLRYRKDFLCKL